VPLQGVTADKKQNLNFAVSVSTKAQREAYYFLAQQFEQENPDVRVVIKALSSEVYKQEFPKLISEDNHYDVMYWHAGQRLNEFVEQGLVQNLNAVWEQQKWSSSFDPSVFSTLTQNGNQYALPISYYQLGFYYRKSLFNRLGLYEPKNWNEFLQVCQSLKKSNIAPIYIGTDSNWPATAWFDYLNIRQNGLDFHMQLVQGKMSFLDPRVTVVLEKLRTLIVQEYFIQGHENLSWIEGLPYIYRGVAGMTLVGNYVVQNIPEEITDDIGFFPFPSLNAGTETYEEGPLDVLIVPNTSNNKTLAYRFLAFAGRADVQSKLNNSLGVISPHRQAQVGTSELLKEAYQTLQKAAGISQFFDRDANKDFADSIMPILDGFIISADVKNTQQELESARLSVPSVQISQ
jgi:multiple sugar transport system substrate-binding protein